MSQCYIDRQTPKQIAFSKLHFEEKDRSRDMGEVNRERERDETKEDAADRMLKALT